MEFGGKLLEISDEKIGTRRKGDLPAGPSRPKAGIGARGRGGIGFVPRQATRKQTVEPVKKGATQGIPAGTNGNAAKVGPKSQNDFRKMLGP
jgi:hypothetical protein